MGKAKQLTKPEAVKKAVLKAKTPEQIIELEAKIDAMERLMRKSGLYALDKIRPLNEARMLARWRLGQMLAQIERKAGPGPGRGKKGVGFRHPLTFLAVVEKLRLSRDRAVQAQRIGTLPRDELMREFSRSAKLDVLNTYDGICDIARPYWYAEQRKARHKKIKQQAKEVGGAAFINVEGGATLVENPIGPFPLIYADPPWTFDTYSDKGLGRTPTQKYPTMTDQEIIDFCVQGKKIPEIAHPHAALILWCTSSNLMRALTIMAAWDFEFKTSAVWVKDKSGMGLVFRNRHEVLLYGTRGNMPGPQYQPPSVFEYSRRAHSEKPREIRAEIEKMYPDFDQSTRLELFGRESVPGWTVYGNEAFNVKAAA